MLSYGIEGWLKPRTKIQEPPKESFGQDPNKEKQIRKINQKVEMCSFLWNL
jgi:hypothetical protein